MKLYGRPEHIEDGPAAHILLLELATCPYVITAVGFLPSALPHTAYCSHINSVVSSLRRPR